MTLRTRASALLGTIAVLIACSSSSGGVHKVIIGAGGDSATGAGGSGTAAGPGAGGSFVLGGGTGGGGPQAGSGGEGLVMNGVCDQQPFNLVRKPPQIVLLLDRSASMKDDVSGNATSDVTKQKWAYVVPGVTAAVTATDNDVDWGLKVFPEGSGNECQASSVTGAVVVPVGPMSAAQVVAGIPATPEGDGTPTAAAINASVTYLNGLGTDNPKYILLATDGEPSCSASFAKDSTQARVDAVAAATAAVGAGIKIFVVGVATTKASDEASLNAVAQAGGEASPDHNPFATKFYLADSQDELVKAIESITSAVATCVFPLSMKPPDPTNIAVVIDKMATPKDPNHLNGWDYTGPDQLGVQVYGSYCDQIKQSANQVLIILGCMGKPIVIPK